MSNVILEKIHAALYSEYPVMNLEALQVEKVFSAYVPEVQAMVGFGGQGTGMKDLWSHTKQVVAQTDYRIPMLRWAALFHDVGKIKTHSRATGKVSFHGHERESARLFYKAAKRLKMPEQDLAFIGSVVSELGLVESYESDWTDSAVRRLTREVGTVLDACLALSRADITTKHEHKRLKNDAKIDELTRRIRTLEEQDAIPQALPKGLGTAITERFNIPPSRALGELMGQLKAKVEAGELPRNADLEIYLTEVPSLTIK